MDFSKNRKGGIMDIFVAMAMALVLIVVLVLLTFSANTVKTKMLQQAPAIQSSFSNDTNVSQIIENTVGGVTSSYDTFKWISVLLIFGFFLSILVSAFLVKTHPAWFIGYVLMIIIAVVLSVYVSNTYEKLMNDSTLAATFLGFTGANYIFLYLPIWILVIGIIAGILMYINLDWGSSYGK